jgi:DNA-binding response OmpR family regulator
MTSIKPQVVYFSDEQEMIELVRSTLSQNFEVIGVPGVTCLDDALSALRQIKPDYVLVDPHLPDLDYQQLNHRLRAEEGLEGVKILLVGESKL